MWHSVAAEEVLRLLGSSPRGLSRSEVERRLSEYGRNEIAERRVSALAMFLGQFKSFLIYILLAATAISLLLGEVLDAALIIAIILLMGVAGFLQEYKAEKAVQALREMAAPRAKVVREGVAEEVDARELVPGDIILLEEGDKVPADARLIEAEDLEVDESPLTGESTPVEKDPGEVLPQDTLVADRRNMVFMGTYVVKGRGRAVVTATGMRTELGRIASSLEEVESERTILEVELDRFGKLIGTVLIALAAVVFLLTILQGESILDSLLTAAALAVAAVPEGLPAVATAVLAIGALRMARKNAIVRRLAAIETLGACNVICSDKTGTITRGEMLVRRVYVDGEDLELGPRLHVGNPSLDGRGLEKLVLACAIHSDATVEEHSGRLVVKGNPTGAALRELSLRAGLRSVEGYPVLRTLHFDRVRKRRSTLHALPDGSVLVLSFGAPELLLERCRWVEENGAVRELRGEDMRRLLKVIEGYAAKGLRTLGAAYRVGDNSLLDVEVEEVERELTFLAVIGISDPPREGVRGAVETARRAGIRVIMVTGDHEATARAIASEVGIQTEAVLTGSAVDRMSDEELERALDGVNVFARVTPEHKLRLVRLLKRKGYVVAMTGDGVNDAPALKAADVGVAMGVKGTDVAKEVSELVLADDNFVTIVEAVREGRIIYENVRKPIDYLLSCNFGEVFAVMGAELMGYPPPLTAAQLLWVNLVTDSLPAFALGLEPGEPAVMEKPPRGRGERLISARRLLAYTLMGALVAGLTLLMLHLYAPLGFVEARTAAFVFFTLGEVLRSLAFRSERRPFFKGLLQNKTLLVSVALTAALSLLPLYSPLASVFEVTPLAPADLLIVISFIAVPLASIELGKAALRALR
ncbi:MAG: cation-translocating P-type ATPase [Thermofilum sp.]|nr:cation-translocating P-type ATPase [Thermofilum sp.]